MKMIVFLKEEMNKLLKEIQETTNNWKTLINSKKSRKTKINNRRKRINPLKRTKKSEQQHRKEIKKPVLYLKMYIEESNKTLDEGPGDEKHLGKLTGTINVSITN